MTSTLPTPEYPRTYRLSRSSRILYRFLGGAVAVVGLFPAYAIEFPRSHGNSQQGSLRVTILVVGVHLLFFVLGISMFRGASRLSVVLTSDAIESMGLWSHATMRLNEIRGRRREPGRGARTILLPLDKKQGKLIIKDGVGFVFDDFYRRWLATIPDLDAIDLEQRRKDGKLRWYEQ